jgi:predicted enzyme related to lactoylglutathione lyase
MHGGRGITLPRFRRKSHIASYPLQCSHESDVKRGKVEVGASHGRFLWYELMTTEPEAAKAFYAEVMGWGTREAPAYSLFTAAEQPVCGLAELPIDARVTGLGPHWTGYIGVDDVDAAAARVGRLGGTIHLPPTDVPNISRFSVVADPQMATFALLKWQNPRREPPPEPAMAGGIGWHELLAADWHEAFVFYRELFGWQKAGADVDATGTYQLFSAGGQAIGGMFTKPAMVPAPFWLFYFTVGDTDAAAERVHICGGQILEGPTVTAGGRRVVRCLDPQGAMFALTGAERKEPIGYFKSSPSDDPAASRFFVRK